VRRECNGLQSNPLFCLAEQQLLWLCRHRADDHPSFHHPTHPL
jgi:hypothetical protein